MGESWRSAESHGALEWLAIASAVWLGVCTLEACRDGVDPCEVGAGVVLASSYAGAAPGAFGGAGRPAWCEPAPVLHVCGDGTVDSGEACDDGNTANGDGCSASCAPDDNLSTPGDDRAGYVQCVTGGLCGPGTRCCGAPTQGCVPDNEACQLILSCDGHEDCAAGAKCVLQRVGPGCALQGGLATICHTDVDCAAALCAGSGTPCPHCDASGTCAP
jgi:cysteine-rich repeat protein